MTNKNRTPEHWAQFANFLFLAYVRQRLGADPYAWGTFARGHYRSATGLIGWGELHPYQDPFKFPQAQSTALAVAEKNQWAQTMSEAPEFPDAAFVRASWDATMQRAEEKIAAYLATLA